MDAPKAPLRDERPWGNFLQFMHNELSTVKILTVKAHEAFSLQYHNKRDEWWHVISGTGTITLGNEARAVIPGEDHFIPRGTKHRITADGQDVVVLEVSMGDFDESDIVRLEDKYGRS